jgi:hypothetical protein
MSIILSPHDVVSACDVENNDNVEKDGESSEILIIRKVNDFQNTSNLTSHKKCQNMKIKIGTDLRGRFFLTLNLT